ncbi:hypothetical protein ABW21_db0204329 [Orbilia brochopaga]|nr:hypothetical protein ABW21_db0204329 [Drechslerella brochopaga]
MAARNVELLPESWPVRGGNAYRTPEEANAVYKALVGRVSGMAAAIINLRLKHKRLLAIRKKLGALANPQQTIQPNLVFKDGELALELKKMRILAARLANELETSRAATAAAATTTTEGLMRAYKFPFVQRGYRGRMCEYSVHCSRASVIANVNLRKGVTPQRQGQRFLALGLLRWRK